MSPSKLEGLGGRFSGEKAEEKPGRKTVAAAHAIENIQLASRRVVDLALDPGDSGPTVAVGGMNLAQSGGDNFNMRMLFHDPINHRHKRAGIELGVRGNLRA